MAASCSPRANCRVEASSLNKPRGWPGCQSWEIAPWSGARGDLDNRGGQVSGLNELQVPAAALDNQYRVSSSKGDMDIEVARLATNGAASWSASAVRS